MRTLIAVIASALVVAAAAAQAPAAAPPAAQGAAVWHAFEGSWSASGQQQWLPTGGAQPARTVQASGALAIGTGEGLSRGFRGEVIGFDDGADVIVGRAVWTDERGDRIFSQLRGDRLATGRRMSGTFTGGTGRYAGATGEYTFEWQYVVSGDGGTLQARTTGMRGRIRATGAPR